MDISLFISGVIGIIGIILGRFLERRSSIKRDHLNHKIIAGLHLRESFMPELTRIRHPSNNDLSIDEILGSAFIKHQTAIDGFRLFLTGNERTAFDDAWNEYYMDPQTKRPSFVQYTEFFDKDGIYPKSARKMAIDRIEAILSFAKGA